MISVAKKKRLTVLATSDLSEVGSQGVVSEILNGKRELNVRQIRFLAEKFKVSSAVFV